MITRPKGFDMFAFIVAICLILSVAVTFFSQDLLKEESYTVSDSLIKFCLVFSLVALWITMCFLSYMAFTQG